MSAAETAKATKKALAAIYGAKRVSVTGGRGTAYGWITARITAPKPAACSCGPERREWCQACREAMRAESGKARAACAAIPYGTYLSDDGYNTEHSRFTVHVEFEA